MLKDASIIDVGGGASTLVDDLLSHGYSSLTVLDLSAAALAAARKRLGSKADLVRWIEADITYVELFKHASDVWHDRAVFHFLITAEQRAAGDALQRRCLASGVRQRVRDGKVCQGRPSYPIWDNSAICLLLFPEGVNSRKWLPSQLVDNRVTSITRRFLLAMRRRNP